MAKVDLYRFLGLSSGAPSAEVEARCEALLRWLKRGDIPAELRPWAKQQATLVEESYRSYLSALDADADVEAEVEVSPAPETGGRGGIWGWLRSPVGFATLGVVAGLAIVMGVLWGTGVFTGEDAAPSPAQEEAFDAQQYLAAHQDRIKELEAAVALNPGDLAALFELGETHMIGEDWEKAIFWFSKLLERDPTDLHAQIDVGTALMNLGRLDQAEAAFKQALGIDPNNVQLHYNMGFLYAFSSTPNYAEAIKHWQRVMELAPGSELAAIVQVHIEQLQGALPGSP